MKKMIKKVVIYTYQINNLVIDYRAREWCKLPYGKSYNIFGEIIRKQDGSIKYSHPKGCPKYNSGAFDCPERSPLIEDYLCLDKNMWFIMAKFDIKTDSEYMKRLHPDWSEKTARCVLYWQNSVNRQLIEACRKFIGFKSLVYTLRPEGMGVHVYKSVKELNIPIETRFEKVIDKTIHRIATILKIALIGYPNTDKKNYLLDYFSVRK